MINPIYKNFYDLLEFNNYVLKEVDTNDGVVLQIYTNDINRTFMMEYEDPGSTNFIDCGIIDYPKNYKGDVKQLAYYCLFKGIKSKSKFLGGVEKLKHYFRREKIEKLISQ